MPLVNTKLPAKVMDKIPQTPVAMSVKNKKANRAARVNRNTLSSVPTFGFINGDCCNV